MKPSFLSRLKRRTAVGLALLAFFANAQAVEIDETVLADGYSQDFNSLPNSNFVWTNDSTLPGWYAAVSTGGINSSARSNDGSSNLNDLTIHSVGSDADRALNYHTRVNSTDTYVGLVLTNTSGRPLTGFELAFTIEQWKEGTESRTVTVAPEYRVGATPADLSAAQGWTPLSTLNTTSAGGAAGNRTSLESGLIDASVATGTTLWIRWKWSNDADSSTSSHDTLALDDVSVYLHTEAAEKAPKIVSQPSLQTVAIGETARFAIEVTGNPQPSLQWYHGENFVPGAQTATLELTNVQLSQAGTYTCVATNPLGTDTSDPATLTVSATPLPPTITLDPIDAVGDLGGALSLTVEATGSPPFVFTWFRGTTEVRQTDTGTLHLNPLAASDAGDYTVVVSNASGSDTSAVAQVAVNLPPTIVTGPSGQSIAGGGNFSLSVSATGVEPLSYQWTKNGEEIEGATAATLSRSNVIAGDSGDYRVTVSNHLGNRDSAAATVMVQLPPEIVLQPQPQNVLAGSSATFVVEAVGAGPLSFQWFKGSTAMPGKNAATLELVGVSSADVADYSVTVSNDFGSTPSSPAPLALSTALPVSAFNLTGFGRATTGGGVIPETDPGYVKVSTPLEFVSALADKSGTIKVIEILNDLDLGYLEVEQAVRDLGNFREHATPKLHPRLIETGVSLIDVQKKSGLTIFSANGATIRHTCINIKASNNIIIRNLKFDEMWEWDEASKGDYDSNDWDFITLGNAGTVWDIWIDHCTFTKSYDGICDIKGGSYNITFSWNNYIGDDGATNPNSFVRQQINELEKNPSRYPMYQFLRTHGFSVEDIVYILQGHDKTHLIGANSLKDENTDHSVTFHHQWYQNPWDRLPRLRGGNVHNYNIFVDAALGRKAKRLRDERVAAMDPADAAKLSSSGSYNFNVFLNGSISTEDAAILVEKSVYLDCLTPLRNNQTDPSNPIYTGKILGLDCITRMTDNAGVSTTVRGDSTDPGNPMGPFQATIKPFSWNLPGGVLPYSYTTDDPSNLPDILLAGAGAGRLQWDKKNWLKTSYVATAPTIVSPLQATTVRFGQDAVLVVGASGDGPLLYEWKKGSAIVPGATGPRLTISEALPGNSGLYTVRVSNIEGEASSSAQLLVLDPSSAELVAYAFGTDSTTGEPFLPYIEETASGYSIFLHRKRANVTYVVEISEDLSQWTTVSTNHGMVGEWVEHADSWTTGQNPRFYRVRLGLSDQ
jgi:pectate lyase